MYVDHSGNDLKKRNEKKNTRKRRSCASPSPSGVFSPLFHFFEGKKKPGNLTQKQSIHIIHYLSSS